MIGLPFIALSQIDNVAGEKKMMLKLSDLKIGDRVRHHAQDTVWKIAKIDFKATLPKSKYQLVADVGRSPGAVKWLAGGTLQNIYVMEK